jgi:hypothetical protein
LPQQDYVLKIVNCPGKNVDDLEILGPFPPDIIGADECDAILVVSRGQMSGFLQNKGKAAAALEDTPTSIDFRSRYSEHSLDRDVSLGPL